jgi:hypothetical protein
MAWGVVRGSKEGPLRWFSIPRPSIPLVILVWMTAENCSFPQPSAGKTWPALEAKSLNQRGLSFLAMKHSWLPEKWNEQLPLSRDSPTPFWSGMGGKRKTRSGDQALVIKLKGKGLVVVSGCAHAGIINTVLYAKKITGVEDVHAVVGGFHLSGPIFEPIIEKTIEAFKEMDLKLIVPMHCTGWKAIQRFSEAFPDSFVLNSVGSAFSLS